MSHKLFVSIISIVFVFSLFQTVYSLEEKEGQESEKQISMDFQDADLKTILKIFSQQAGLNFIASQNVQDRKVTVYFDGVRVEDALNHIMKANRITYEQEQGSSIFIVKEAGVTGVETISKIYELKFAQISPPPSKEGGSALSSAEPEILTIVRGLLSEHGKLVADKRSNSIIIEDVPSQLTIIEELLLKLDVPIPQIMIEAEILETTTTLADELGMDWSGTFGVYAGPAHNTIWPLRGRFGKDTSFGEGISATGSVNLSGMGATLNALLSHSDTRVLARPKVLTMNNEKAVIELTAHTAVASITTTTDTGSSSTTSNQAERIETGITLEVTPQVNQDGYITMHIQPKVIVPVLSTYFAGGNDQKYVDPQTRSANTTVRVKAGETIIIGGLISRDTTDSFEKIPFFGDIPILGLAFRYKTKSAVDKELIMFITPRIVGEDKYLIGDDSFEREQEKPKEAKEKEVKGLLNLFGG